MEVRRISKSNEIIEQKYSIQSIQNDYQSGKELKFIFFWKPQPSLDGTITESCLSQWWQSDFEVDGQKYTYMEQFMMACKARLFHDDTVYAEILQSQSPKQMLALGRKVKGFKQRVWDTHKFSIIYYGNFMKFSQNEDLKKFLLSTKNHVIVEASPCDGIWGIKMAASEEEVDNPTKWRGQNLLGCALMQVRDTLL